MRDCGCADHGIHKAACPLAKPRPAPAPRPCGCSPYGRHRKECEQFKPIGATTTRIVRSVDRDALWDVRRTLLAMADARREEHAHLQALADRIGRLIANTDGDPTINSALRDDIRRVTRGIA